HAAVLRAVLSGELDAGATYRAAPQEYLTPEQAAELVVIGTTDPVASDVFAVRRGSPDAERIRDALLSVGGAPDARRILAPMNAQSLAPADERAFDSARKIDLLVSEQDEP
ncbi:MAG: PhnD/SsuA/transferrin family substrate-binding protein, partial [Myxococcales bacterium]